MSNNIVSQHGYKQMHHFIKFVVSCHVMSCRVHHLELAPVQLAKASSGPNTSSAEISMWKVGRRVTGSTEECRGVRGGPFPPPPPPPAPAPTPAPGREEEEEDESVLWLNVSVTRGSEGCSSCMSRGKG